MKVYVLTMILRAIVSFILLLTAATGIGIAATNNLKHNYFEFFYFLVVFLSEMTMTGIYLWLYRMQRGL